MINYLKKLWCVFFACPYGNHEWRYYGSTYATNECRMCGAINHINADGSTVIISSGEQARILALLRK